MKCEVKIHTKPKTAKASAEVQKQLRKPNGIITAATANSKQKIK